MNPCYNSFLLPRQISSYKTTEVLKCATLKNKKKFFIVLCRYIINREGRSLEVVTINLCLTTVSRSYLTYNLTPAIHTCIYFL